MVNCLLPENKNLKVCKFNSKCVRDGKTFCGDDKKLGAIMPYTGGKSFLASQIISEFPNHQTYVEPMVGGGSIFLAKPLAKTNIINDIDKETIKVFKNPNALKNCGVIKDKKEFSRIKAKKNKSACEIVALKRSSFGSQGSLSKKRYKKSFRNKRFNKNYEIYKKKLNKAKILNQDFEQVMRRYDGKNTLHYLDPPYVVSLEKGNYYKKQNNVDPERVCKIANQMKGKVILSYDNHPKVKLACNRLKVKKIKGRYTKRMGGDVKKTELLLTNF